MKKIVFLCGLPGSGKSFFGDEIFSYHRHREESAIFLDDMGVEHSLQDLVEAVRVGYQNIIIADVHLCREEDRKHALKRMIELAPGYALEWIYFENDPIKCLKNVEYRDDGRKVKEAIRELSKRYVIPEGVEPKIIWQP
jgi:predicted kinase